MQAHFLGYTQQGVSWQTPRCPVCGFFYPKVEEICKHFNDLHSLGQNWFHVSAQDPRLPGTQFHLLVDDPTMAKALEGQALNVPKR